MKAHQTIDKVGTADSLNDKSSSDLISSISLIAGTTIGAGILALPAATLPAGIVPSTLLMMCVWLYMAAAGLLVAEANLYAMEKLGRRDVGLLATIEFQLGRGGAIAAGLLYAFIHYSLLVAYAARGGDILAAAARNLESQLGIEQAIPLWWGHIAFVVVFGSLVALGKEQFVGRLNSGLLGIVILSFFGLLAFTFPQIDATRWSAQHWDSIGAAVPVMFVAFVYHNVVPVVTTRLQASRTQIRRAILLGSLIPLVMFLLWNAVILGSVAPVSTVDKGMRGVVDPIEMLRSGVDGSGLGVAVSVFSEFAVVTSFIGFIYGLVNFFSDIFRSISDGVENRDEDSSTTSLQKKNPRVQALMTYGLVLIPPTFLSILSPSIFFDAIDLSGAFGISILFGIIPAVMTWKQRYQGEPDSETALVPMVRGGKLTLSVMISVAVTVLLQHTFIKVGIL